MVKLRLKRMGKKKSAFYRIVASDSRIQRDGKYIDLLGTYDPNNNNVKVNDELVLKWLSNGAQPTDTVRDIFSKKGIMKKFHEIKMQNKKTKSKKNVNKNTKQKSVDN